MKNHEQIYIWDDRKDVVLNTYFAYIATATKPRPAILILPGGGYYYHDKGGFEGDSVAMSYAADGYQAFVLEYSIVPKAPAGGAMFPAQLFDVARAMVIIHERSREWGIDPDNIYIAGFSAGAHLAATYSCYWYRPLLLEGLGVNEELLKPAATIMMYGMSDYTTLFSDPALTESDFFDPNMNIPILGSASPADEVLERWSPALLATEKNTPTFIACATDDVIVNPEQSMEMAMALKKLGVPYELHMFELGGHAFGLARNPSEPWRLDYNRSCSQWLPLSKEFLLRRIAPTTAEKDRIHNM